MEHSKISPNSRKICRIGLGTWAIGGWLWGGTDEKEAISAIHHALDLGINLIDTAPIYGFGVSEEIVGKALKTYGGKKENAFIATKAGLNWNGKEITRDSSKKRIVQEIHDSLKRLQVDHIDLYQIHWPDLNTPFSETAEAMQELKAQGKILSIGVSNYSVEQMKDFKKGAKIDVLQSPYNLFESDLDLKEIPYCKKEKVAILGYGSLCRGLLSGRMHEKSAFQGDDLRKIDPKFQKPRYSQYLNAAEKLKKWAENKHKKSLVALSLRWCLDKEIDFPLWGIRKPSQLENFQEVWGWKLTEEDNGEIATILVETIRDPVGPDFMAPKADRHKVKV